MARAEDRRHHLLLAVFCGGMLGTVLRAATGELLPHDPGQWPWSTLIVNVAGAVLIGWWSVRLPRAVDLDPRLRPFLITGVCGGLTTFSALQLDSLELRATGVVGYFVVSVVVGLLAVAVGRRAARLAHRGSPA